MTIECDAIIYKHARKLPLDDEEKKTLKAWEDRLQPNVREEVRKDVLNDYERKL